MLQEPPNQYQFNWASQNNQSSSVGSVGKHYGRAIARRVLLHEKTSSSDSLRMQLVPVNTKVPRSFSE